MSRVRKRDDLRIWPIREDQMEYLLKMKPSRDFTLWINNYSDQCFFVRICTIHDNNVGPKQTYLTFSSACVCIFYQMAALQYKKYAEYR